MQSKAKHLFKSPKRGFMKKYLFSLIVIAGLFNSCGPTHIVVEEHPYRPAPPPPPPPPAEAPYQEFYDQLSPYGQWIDYPGYGYVFMPNVAPDFKPYSTNGHWVYTDQGWTWASDYNWGWATFHYGRWFYEDGYGWMWIPGHEWAPAWVSWRRSPDYYGWAPLGPGVSINVSIGGGYNPPAHYWSFVQPRYINHPHVNNYYVNESRNVTIINTTTVNNNIHNNYPGGPDPREVEKQTGAPVRPVPIRENNRPGEQLDNSQLAIYRPRGNAAQQQNGNNNMGSAPVKPAPPKTITLNQVHPVNTTRYNNGGAPVQNNMPPAQRNNNNGFNQPGNANNNSNPVTPVAHPPAVQPNPAPVQPRQPVTAPPNNNNNNNRYSPGRPAQQQQQTMNPPANNSNNNNPPVTRYTPGRPVQQQPRTMQLPPEHKIKPDSTYSPRPAPKKNDQEKRLEPHKDDRNN